MAVGRLVGVASQATLATSSSASVTVPNDGSVVVGDLLIVGCVMPSGSRTFSISGGAGAWTSLGTATQSGHMSQLWWRVAQAGDLGATITVTPSTGSIRQVLLLGKVTGAHPTSPVTAASNTSASATTKTTPSLGSAPVGSREVSLVWDSRGASTPNTSAWTAPAGETRQLQAFTTSGSGACSGAMGDSDTTLSGTIGSRVWTADQTALGSAWTLAVAPADQTITPARIDPTATLPAPTATPGTATITPGLLGPAGALYAPQAVPGPVTLAPARVEQAASLYAPIVQPGTATLAAPTIGATTALYGPAVQPGPVTLAPDTIPAASAPYTPTLLSGAVLTPSRIDTTAAVHPLTLAPGPVTVQPALTPSTAALPAPTITGGAEPVDDVDVTIGQPYTTWAAGTPHTSWEVGHPWA